ncbi:SIMPL domain-containing protein [Pseudochryseolinea flava]|uniref:SIMPL domain-containing protein n=1 Tax=Pseudochryseolinea flava TaxID=2059302 RepID=A0A364Y7G2_9BACT|nr:SIMPL domain-containing protein [Pseudochryseolinea flava]RAW03011.1 hypothetical protein DQQ10_02620 [Pseudochryseolinea flava]
MKHLTIITLIIFNTPLFAQKSGNSNFRQHGAAALPSLQTQVNDQHILFSVHGLLNVKADYYVVIFNVTQLGETAQETDSLLSRRVDKFEKEMRRMGIDSIEIVTDMITFVPRYDFKVVEKLFSKTYNEVPDGFELQKNIIVTYKKTDQLNQIITAAATAEIYDLGKVDYFINDVSKQHEKLRLKCLEYLKEKIKSYEIVGVKLDGVKRSLSEDFATMLPHNRYEQYTAVARPSMRAIKRASGNLDKISYADLTPSRFYNAIAYDQYDVVLNPVVREPMVQLTYRVNIQFDLKETADTKTQVLFITPNGQLQNIDLTKAIP